MVVLIALPAIVDRGHRETSDVQHSGGGRTREAGPHFVAPFQHVSSAHDGADRALRTAKRRPVNEIGP